MDTRRLKVLLLAVCCEGMDEFLEEIGLCSIASVLRQDGYEVMLMEVREERVDYDKILEFHPDVVGYSMYGISKEPVYRVNEKIKGMLPEIYSFVGGTMPSTFHLEILEEAPLIDSVLRGEGELVTLEMVNQLEAGGSMENVKGMTYRLGDQVLVNEDRELLRDLDTLPWPARDLLVQNDLKFAIISTSRGCTSKCSFCPSHVYWKRWRGRSPENIVDEIEHIYNTYGIKLFNFIDCSFEDPDEKCERLRGITQGIVDRQLNISWFADMRAEFHRKADASLMELLKKSGMCGVCVGIESANEPDLRLYNKRATVEDNEKFTELFHEYDINIIYGFINFNPYSDFPGLYKNADFLEKHGFAVNMDTIINRYSIYKGSDLYNKTERDGLLTDVKYSIYGYHYGYHFVDSRIEKLANYIESFVNEANQRTNSAFLKLKIYGNDFMTILNHVRKTVDSNPESGVDQICDAFRMEYDNLKAEVNQANANWFRELIVLAETGWSAEAADQISQKYLSDTYLSQITGKFGRVIHKLYAKLLRIDQRYSDIFEYLSR